MFEHLGNNYSSYYSHVDESESDICLGSMIFSSSRIVVCICIYIDIYTYICLVGGFKHFLIVHSIWDVILPIDEVHHFSEG